MKINKIMAAALTLTLLTPAATSFATETQKYELQGETFDSLEAYRNRIIEEINGIKNQETREDLIASAKSTNNSMELSRIYSFALNAKLEEYLQANANKQTVEDEKPSEQPVIDLEKEKAEWILSVDDYNFDEKIKQDYIKRINEARGLADLQNIALEMYNRSLVNEDNTNNTSETETPSVEDETPSEQSTETPAEDGTIKEDTTKSESKKTVDQQKNSSNLNENSPVQKINSNNKEAGKNSKTGVGSLSTVVGILVASAYAYKSTEKEN